MGDKEDLFAFVKQELINAGFEKTSLYNSILNLFDDVLEITENPENIQYFSEMLVRLSKSIPITPITENDFENTPNHKGVYKCIRYPYIYKDAEGKIYNDRHYAFELDENNQCVYIYNGKITSKQEITLPYTVCKRTKPYY